MLVLDASAVLEMLLRTPAVAERRLDDFMDLRVERHEHAPLLARAWQLRGGLSGHDARIELIV